MEDKIKYYPEDQLPNKEQIIKEKGIFIDPYFKAEDSSIFGKEVNNENKNTHKWTRIFSEEKIPLAKNEDNFMGFFSTDKGLNITQGSLGNCYFISYLHRLKEDFPGIFFSIFRDCKPAEGYFEVYFYYKENNNKISKRIVFVDDFIPYKEFPSYCRPLYCYYNSDPQFNKFMVGKYLLIEKAYAKFKGCYYNIRGRISDTAIFFDLTGVDHEILYLSDIIIDHSDKLEINISKENFRKNYEKKKIIIEKKKLNEEAKNNIYNKINSILNENLVNAGTEDKSAIGQINKFGIYANHRYDLLKCEKFNQSIFIHLWNPHGINKIENKFYGFESINKINEDGLNNGNITLDFDGFFLSFKRLIYQNKDKILEIYKKFEGKGILDAIGILPYEKILFMFIFGFDINYGLSLLLFRSYLNKGKDIKTIFSDLMKEIGTNRGLDRQQLFWFLIFWEKSKKEILKESEIVMKKKLKDMPYETDINKIIDLLMNENENSNDYFNLISKQNIYFLDEKLKELKKDIEPIARQLAEKYIKDNKEEEERIRISREIIRRKIEEQEKRRKEEEEKERRRRSQESWRRYINKNIAIRSYVGNKNLDIQGGNEMWNGIKIILWDAHGGWNQKFKMVLNEDGSVSFLNKGFAIDAYGGVAKNGTQINIWGINWTNAQKFYLEDVGGGWYRIHSSINRNYCIDVNGFCSDNGTKIQLWEKNDSIAQKFKFIE